jgi:3,4-dihydroxy-9,10-secoandrosta-1,3,5(10)-triene-9,17-dione 4,5-dioxygenase
MSILSLGYLHMGSPHLAAWEAFGAETLGLMPTKGPDEASRYFRWDAFPYRLQLEPAETAGIQAVGFEVQDDRALDAVCRTIEAAGRTVTRCSDEQSASRQVTGLAQFVDPAGLSVELFYGPVLTHATVVTPQVSGFVTGEQGMGHIVVNVDDLGAQSDFYRDVLGFQRRNTWAYAPMALEFLGCNPRHHTVAFGEALPTPGLAHFRIETATIDDVGRALDRCLDAGVPIISGLGRHTNDHMISFYCLGPDGYAVEFGWGAQPVTDPATEGTYRITQTSFWGHRPLKA